MHATANSSASPGWLRRGAARLGMHGWTKFLGLGAGMTAFFAAYFWLLRHPLHPPFIMPLTPVDRWVAFSPVALPVYLSLWVYVVLAPGLTIGCRGLLAYAAAAVGLAVVGLGIFCLWPTAVPPADIAWSEHPAFEFLKTADASGNACPSLHVGFAVFTAFALVRPLRQIGAGRGAHLCNWVWCAAILWSTVATRQHVFLDVVAGAACGVLAAVPLWRLAPAV